MNHNINGQEKYRGLPARGSRSERERYASPRLSTSRGDSRLYRWPTTPISSYTAASGPSQPLEQRIDLHPTLSQAIEAYSRGEINYARAMRNGGAYIEGVVSLSDTERDGIFLKFLEALDRTDRRKGDLQRERRENQTGGEPGKEEEVGRRRDWREKRGKDGKLKISESEYPWYKSELALTDSQRKTRESLERFRKDIGLAVRSVKSAPGRPNYFPDSEWENILRGRSVDLGRVLASLRTTAARQESSIRIEDGGDWQAAWNLTAEATAFVFPHRQPELHQYTTYIIQKLCQRDTTRHARIIRFDEAIRKAVGGGEVNSLLDREIREYFTESILQPDGVDYWSSAPRAYPHRPLCHRFNGEVGCSNSYCPYEHRCRSCKEGDHGQAHCQKHRPRRERWNGI